MRLVKAGDLTINVDQILYYREYPEARMDNYGCVKIWFNKIQSEDWGYILLKGDVAKEFLANLDILQLKEDHHVD